MKYYSALIIVEDIERSKAFYTKIMGQKILHDFGKNVIFEAGFTIWELQPTHIIYQKLNTSKGSNRCELYFEDENIDWVYEILKQAEVRFFHGIIEEDWGQRTLRFFDYDEHLVEVGEPLEVFVRNMSKKGLSPEEISKKSGIAEKDVLDFLECA
jgi:catechol 2,3-dioxygenase-like lactoylglutathione lyase family enzyme